MVSYSVCLNSAGRFPLLPLFCRMGLEPSCSLLVVPVPAPEPALLPPFCPPEPCPPWFPVCPGTPRLPFIPESACCSGLPCPGIPDIPDIRACICASVISPCAAASASCSASNFASPESLSASSFSWSASACASAALIAAALPSVMAPDMASAIPGSIPALSIARARASIALIASPAVFCSPRIFSSRCSPLSSATMASSSSRLARSSRFRSSVSFRSSAFCFSSRPASSSSAASSIAFSMEAVFRSSAFRAATARSPLPGSRSVAEHSTISPAPIAARRRGNRRGICFTSRRLRCSQASWRWQRVISVSGPPASSSAVTLLSRSPQASAARAASRAFTGRAAFPRAPRSVQPEAAAPAMSHLPSSGTNDVTASRMRAASAPMAKPAPAPCSRRCRRRRRFAGASAFRSSFIVSGPFSAVYLRVFRRFQRSPAKNERGSDDQHKRQQGNRAAADQRHSLPAGLLHQAEVIQDPAGFPVFQP